ncbi:MAG: translation elongation factor Ts [Mycobacteriales bacterium]
MADVTAADIKRLRELTGAGMSDCKVALVEADGDLDRAIEALRLKGVKGVVKRGERTASNGLVTAHVAGPRSASLLEVNCETDFVAKGERFQQLAAEILAALVETRPPDVPALLDAPAAGGHTVQGLLETAGAALGEKLEVRRFATFDEGFVAVYQHRTSPDLPPAIGVMVEFDADPGELGRDLAQHIAWAAPMHLSREEVPEQTLATERRIAEQLAREEGKPEAALSKIVDGRVGGYFKAVVLGDQGFVKDAKRSVGQVLGEAGVSVRRFVRFKVGEA